MIVIPDKYEISIFINTENRLYFFSMLKILTIRKIRIHTIFSMNIRKNRTIYSKDKRKLGKLGKARPLTALY